MTHVERVLLCDPPLTSPVYFFIWITGSLIDKRADVVLPALTSISDEAVQAVAVVVGDVFVGEHIVRCNAACTHELLHEPVGECCQAKALLLLQAEQVPSRFRMFCRWCCCRS